MEPCPKRDEKLTLSLLWCNRPEKNTNTLYIKKRFLTHHKYVFANRTRFTCIWQTPAVFIFTQQAAECVSIFVQIHIWCANTNHLHKHTQRIQPLSLNKPTVFSVTLFFRNHSNMLILFPRNISYFQCWKQFSAAFELLCTFSRSMQNYSLQCGSHLGKLNWFSNSHP